MDRIARYLVGHRLLSLLLAAVVSLVAAVGVARLELDDDLAHVFSSSSSDASSMNALAERFRLGDDDFLILVEAGDVLSPATFELIRELHFELEEIPGSAQVTSLASARSRQGSEGYYPPLFPAPGAPAEEYARAREEALGHPLLVDLLLSRDARATLILVTPDATLRSVAELEPLQRAIEEALDSVAAGSGVTATVTGMPVLRTRIIRAVNREQVLFTLGGVLIAALVSYVTFRSAAALLLTLPVPVLAILWSLGTLGLMGEPLNAVNVMITPLVIVVAVADSVHLLYAIRRRIAAGLSPSEAAREAVVEVGPACFVTSLTTGIADVSLAASGSAVIARFGLVCALSVMLVFFAVILVVPALANSSLGRRLAPSPKPSPRSSWRSFLRSGPAPSRGPALVDRLADFVERHTRPLAVTALALTVASLGACLLLRPDYRYRENLPASDPAFETLDRIGVHFGGVQPLYVVIESAGVLDLQSPELRACLAAVHRVLEGADHAGKPISLLTIADAFAGSPDLSTLLAESPAEMAARLLDQSGRATLVTMALADAGAARLAPVLAEIESGLERARREHPGFEIRTAGLAASSIQASQAMIGELATSLFASALFIFLVIAILLRSLPLGLLSALPNVLPIAAVGAFLVITGRPLQYITVLSMVICLGIAFDDTIHFLVQFKSAPETGTPERVRTALRRAGPAMATSTLVILLGLSLLELSSLPTVRLFGRVSMLALSSALVADLIFTPALVLQFCGRRRSASPSLPQPLPIAAPSGSMWIVAPPTEDQR